MSFNKALPDSKEGKNTTRICPRWRDLGQGVRGWDKRGSSVTNIGVAKTEAAGVGIGGGCVIFPFSAEKGCLAGWDEGKWAENRANGSQRPRHQAAMLIQLPEAARPVCACVHGVN